MRWMLVVVVLVGCADTNAVVCGDITCPPGGTCVLDGAGNFLACEVTESIAACADVEEGTRCTTTEIAKGRCEAGTCHPIVCFTDDFALALDRDRYDFYSTNQSTVATSDGKLVIGIAPIMNSYQGLVTVDAFDLTNGSMQAWVEPPTTGAEAYFEISVHLGLKFSLVYRPGSLTAQVTRSMAVTNLVSVPYDPVAHRYWQIKNDADKLQYSTSPDGETWTLLRELNESSRYASFKSVKLVLTAGAYNTLGGMGRFDDLEIVTPVCAGL